LITRGPNQEDIEGEKGALIRNYMTSIASLIYKIFEKE
jgi:hypothetical protein